jgi:hypothetical protein
LLAAGSIFQLLLPRLRPQPPEPADWLEVARTVRDSWQIGDGVRIEPTWMTAGRGYFADVDGLAAEPFRILDLHDPMNEAFLYRFRRIWWVSAMGHSQDPSGFPRGSQVRDTMQFPRISVSLLEMPSDVAVWSLADHLRSASVQRPDGEGRTGPCGFSGSAFRCGWKGLADPAWTLRQVAGGPREGLVLVPGPKDSWVALMVDNVPGPGELRFQFGQTVEAARQREGGRTEVSLAVDGQEKLSRRLLRRDYELHEAVIQLSPGTHQVVFRFRSDDPQRRELSVNAWVLRFGKPHVQNAGMAGEGL